MAAVVGTFMPSGLWNVANEETFILRPSSQNYDGMKPSEWFIFFKIHLCTNEARYSVEMYLKS